MHWSSYETPQNQWTKLDRTVIMVQVENENRPASEARDYSPAATKLFQSAVPGKPDELFAKPKRFTSSHYWFVGE